MRSYLPLLALAFLVSPRASAEVFVVDPEGTGSFPTIQSAVDAAAEGDTILLTRGIFRGDGNRDIEIVEKNLTITAQSGDPTETTIDCEGSLTETHFGLSLVDVGPSATIEGISITNAVTNDWGAGMILLRSSPLIQDCMFTRNQAFTGGGVNCDVDSDPTFVHCTFWSNSARQGGGMCL